MFEDVLVENAKSSLSIPGTSTLPVVATVEDIGTISLEVPIIHSL